MLHFLTSFLMLAIRVSQTANMFFIVIWGPLKTNEWVACFHTKIPTGCYIDVHAPGLFRTHLFSENSSSALDYICISRHSSIR